MNVADETECKEWEDHERMIWNVKRDIDMKRDIVFWSSKRFKFEKIEENDFRLDGHQNGQSQRLKISNLNLLCVRV